MLKLLSRQFPWCWHVPTPWCSEGRGYAEAMRAFEYQARRENASEAEARLEFEVQREYFQENGFPRRERPPTIRVKLVVAPSVEEAMYWVLADDPRSRCLLFLDWFWGGNDFDESRKRAEVRAKHCLESFYQACPEHGHSVEEFLLGWNPLSGR